PSTGRSKGYSSRSARRQRARITSSRLRKLSVLRWRGNSPKGAGHGRFAQRPEREPGRGQSDRKRSFRLAAHPPCYRAHDQGVVAHRGRADRLRLRHRQYLEHLEQTPGARSAYLPHAPRYLGLALISCGILALFVSIWQYWWGIRYLWGEPFALIAGVTR